MLHNEARELLVQGYEATHDAKGIAKAYSVSKWTVYRLAEQKRKTGSVALRTSQRGRKPVLTAEDKENIQHCMDETLCIGGFKGCQRLRRHLEQFCNRVFGQRCFLEVFRFRTEQFFQIEHSFPLLDFPYGNSYTM